MNRAMARTIIMRTLIFPEYGGALGETMSGK